MFLVLQEVPGWLSNQNAYTIVSMKSSWLNNLEMSGMIKLCVYNCDIILMKIVILSFDWEKLVSHPLHSIKHILLTYEARPTLFSSLPSIWLLTATSSPSPQAPWFCRSLLLCSTFRHCLYHQLLWCLSSSLLSQALLPFFSFSSSIVFVVSSNVTHPVVCQKPPTHRLCRKLR